MVGAAGPWEGVVIDAFLSQSDDYCLWIQEHDNEKTNLPQSL